MIAFLKVDSRYGTTPRPRWDVLIDIALDEGKPADALGYYDLLRAGDKSAPPPFGAIPDAYADRVAEAVADSHPDRALKIYKADLDRVLPTAAPWAYERSANDLARLRPLYEALGRGPEWIALVASIREKYRNRPRFMEQLDRTLNPAGRKSAALKPRG